MNVGIFGGTFDPPHLAHLVAAETARDQFGLARVLWIPTREPPHKEHFSASPDHRLAMTRRATEHQGAFVASEIEIERGGPSYTVDTVRQLQQENPETDFTLILGGDSLQTFHTWRAPGEIARRVSLVAYERAYAQPGKGAESPFVEQAQFVDAPRLDVSSTDVRRRCREGRSIRYLVPSRVRSYIERHDLYTAPTNAAARSPHP